MENTVGFLILENGKYLCLRPENGNSTPYCPPSIEVLINFPTPITIPYFNMCKFCNFKN